MDCRYDVHRDVVIIGGGQSGLATGYYLTQRNIEYVILEASGRVGDSWRHRWDSLRLFTQAKNSSLPGMRFPSNPESYPTKDEVANYLESYVSCFSLPVRLDTRVKGVDRAGERYRVETDDGVYHAKQVIIATGPFLDPSRPTFSEDIGDAIDDYHSSEYMNPSHFETDGDILVVGAGNAGTEIALELACTGRRTLLAGPSVGYVPMRVFNSRFFWWLATNLLTAENVVCRMIENYSRSHGDPLVRYSESTAKQANVERVGRVTGVEAGYPVIESGQRLNVSGVVWATGFDLNYEWLNIPGLEIDSDGYPIHDRGIVPGELGLYFVGLPYQTTLVSASLGGVGVDADRIASTVAQRLSPHTDF
ncbi:NAD(P)/FAD-dependent oxidoreductase [Halococcus sp. IIIV-5B]|uniref:flavin-containing monooxygenase n=1 Tax=Halococcus sp. IIIV-5B TaxID=2321230 RepID=UPI000E71436A|nr:NAD(P)-binding domain-containing protein [Halococcus sp. IIIV-5B]RJT07533.1 pyridine nucleotide-disulfide oxidoreductase [Halococcus sp. IIIV-5B]